MDIEEAVYRGYPVISGVQTDRNTKIWCDHCFTWHYHGKTRVEDGPQLRGAHCYGSTSYYLIVIDEQFTNEAVAYAYRATPKLWRADCWCKKGFHQTRTIGVQMRPHIRLVIPRPGPGSPRFCEATGRFFDGMTGKPADPPCSEDRLSFYNLEVRPELWTSSVGTG